MDSYEQLTHDLKNCNYQSAMEALDKMERDLKEIEEKFLKLTVRSYLLEVSLAVQFSPDLMLSLERVEQSCDMCAEAVTNETLAVFTEEQSLDTSIQPLTNDIVEETCITDTEPITTDII